MYNRVFYFASRSKNTARAILPLAKYNWLKTRVSAVLWPREAKMYSFLHSKKYNKTILPSEEKALLELF